MPRRLVACDGDRASEDLAPKIWKDGAAAGGVLDDAVEAGPLSHRAIRRVREEQSLGPVWTFQSSFFQGVFTFDAQPVRGVVVVPQRRELAEQLLILGQFADAAFLEPIPERCPDLIAPELVLVGVA